MICIPFSDCPQYVLGKILIPVTWLLGVDPSECEAVGKLIGLKMTINEFVAYKQMGDLIKEGKLNVSVVGRALYFTDIIFIFQYSNYIESRGGKL